MRSKIMMCLAAFALVSLVPAASANYQDWPGTERFCMSSDLGNFCPPDYRPIVVPLVTKVYDDVMETTDIDPQAWQDYASDAPGEVVRFAETGCMRAPPMGRAHEICMLA